MYRDTIILEILPPSLDKILLRACIYIYNKHDINRDIIILECKIWDIYRYHYLSIDTEYICIEISLSWSI